jgi:hypothetical protein
MADLWAPLDDISAPDLRLPFLDKPCTSPPTTNPMYRPLSVFSESSNRGIPPASSSDRSGLGISWFLEPPTASFGPHPRMPASQDPQPVTDAPALATPSSPDREEVLRQLYPNFSVNGLLAETTPDHMTQPRVSWNTRSSFSSLDELSLSDDDLESLVVTGGLRSTFTEMGTSPTMPNYSPGRSASQRQSLSSPTACGDGLQRQTTMKGQTFDCYHTVLVHMSVRKLEHFRPSFRRQYGKSIERPTRSVNGTDDTKDRPHREASPSISPYSSSFYAL